MSYRELLPDIRLRDYVACYWTIATDNAPGYRLILPDGCTDIIFNFGDPLASKSAHGESVNSFKSFIVGNMTRAIFSRPLHRCDLFGIRFKAAGLYALLNDPLHQFTDSVVDFAHYKPFHSWLHRLAETPVGNRACVVDHLLLKHLSPVPVKTVQHSLKLIKESRGIIRIAALSKHVGASQKQLERLFKTTVGLTPKQVARVEQFGNMITLIRAREDESLLQLATDAGYSDHAHLTKSFKEFSGFTPEQFLLR